MKTGTHFNIPETEEDFRSIWEESDVLDEDTTPQWLIDNGETISGWRYVMNTSWAYLRAEDQDLYFEELDALDEAEYLGKGHWYGIAVDGDDGDGCVHHVYIRRSMVVE